MPGPAVETSRAFASVTVHRTTAYPLCAVMSFSSLGSPQRTWRGWISANSALEANLFAPRSPISSPHVASSQKGRDSFRSRRRRAASILHNASSFTSAQPRPNRTPSFSVSAHGSAPVSVHRSAGPPGTVSTCVTSNVPPVVATRDASAAAAPVPPGPASTFTSPGSPSCRLIWSPAASYRGASSSAAARVP